MTKTNIDLGASTSVALSTSFALTAGALQETNVGFDSTTKFLFQCGFNASYLSTSCSYSMKEWLISGTQYRTTGAFAKFATKSIEAGCKSFFAGGDSINISSKDKLQFLANTGIKVRVDSNMHLSRALPDDTSGVILLDLANCKIEKCTDIKVNVGNQNTPCVDISNNADMSMSLLKKTVQLNSQNGVNVFDDFVSVGSESTSLANGFVETNTQKMKIKKAMEGQTGMIRITGALSIAG